MKCAAVILAGGNSARMNFPKPFLHCNEQSFLETIIDVYRKAGIKEVVVVLNGLLFTEPWTHHIQALSDKADFIKNDFPERGRFHSLKKGLENLKEREYCFIQNVDNPFVGHTLVKTLFRYRDPKAYVIPICKGKGGHPVLLNETIIKKILHNADDNLTLNEFLRTHKRRAFLLEDESVLVNINTPEEYAQYMPNHNYAATVL